MTYFCCLSLNTLLLFNHNLTHAAKRGVNSVENDPLITLITTYDSYNTCFSWINTYNSRAISLLRIPVYFQSRDHYVGDTVDFVNSTGDKIDLDSVAT